MSETPTTDWYRFGDGLLGVRSDDVPFQDRFRTVFAECALADRPADGLPRVLCTVRHDDQAELALVHFDDPEPLDAAHFATSVFADRAYRVESEALGWSIVGGPDADAGSSVAFRGPSAVVSRGSRWQPLLGNLALNRVLRLQRDVLFLHAGSTVVSERGVLLAGPKESGKTTLSASLAARGHGFLGDELSAIRMSTLEMLPFRRAISFREGPKSAAVDGALARDPAPRVEQYPDGTPRRRALPRDLFPDAPTPEATLDTVFVLKGFAERPRADRFEPAPADTAALSPFASSLWGVPEALRALRVGAVMARCDCYHLHAGDPDETADLVERIMEDGCP